MQVLQFVSAFGLGALASALVQYWLSRRATLADRAFVEKKEAYIGLLEAIHRSEVEKTDAAALLAGHWIFRCELVGSPSVVEAVEELLRTNPVSDAPHPSRPDVMKALKSAMRKDLLRGAS